MAAEVNLVVEIDNGYDIDPEFAASLVRASHEDRGAFEYAKYLSGVNLLEGRVLSKSLGIFAGAVMRDIFPVPTSKGRKVSNWYRNGLLIRGIRKAEALSILASRNDASNSHCGCWLVHEALIKVKPAPISFSRVAEIWKNRAKIERDLEKINLMVASSQTGPGD